MKKKIVALFSFLLIFTLALFGCNSIKLSSGPKWDDAVYGNGGSAVVKGNYLYFANAFVDYTTLGINDNTYDQNKNSQYLVYAIYRTKLDDLGKVNLDENGVPVGAEILTYKIGGFAYSGLYICGEYLYYTTPYSKDSNSGETKTGLVQFERVKLDGTGHKEIFSASDYSSDASYNIVHINGVTYIVYVNSSKDIKIISCNGDNTKGINDKPIASSVTSYAVFDQKNIDKNNNVATINQYVYYTKKDDNNLYYLYRTSLINKTEELFYGATTEEILLKAVKNDRVYFTVGGLLYSKASLEGQSVLYTNMTFGSGSSSEESSSSNTIVDYLILDGSLGNNLDRGVIVELYDGTNYILSWQGADNSSKTLEISSDNSKKITLLGTQENEFYYQIADDKALYRCSLTLDLNNGSYKVADFNFGEKLIEEYSTTVTSTVKFEFDRERIYAYLPVDESTTNYLTMFMLDTDIAFRDEATNNFVGQYIGKK